ncbi:MAG TPA: hypothetical protein VHA06_01090 [Candidatus Angelobacter sp.]|jgi:hypothetical protein|nr:hypothetical protein [Candidatus Angelobacter sp.]
MPNILRIGSISMVFPQKIEGSVPTVNRKRLRLRLRLFTPSHSSLLSHIPTLSLARNAHPKSSSYFANAKDHLRAVAYETAQQGENE